MEVLMGILCILFILALLKLFGKGIIFFIAAFATPFYAAFQLVTGKAENKKNALIIFVCGMIVAICVFIIVANP